MSISPVASSSNFSFLPDIEDEENQEASSNQEVSLRDRIYTVIDRLGYSTYSVFNRPKGIMPIELAEAQYEVDKKKFFADKPKSFEEIRKRVLAYPEDLCSWSWGHKIERENIELYSDPKFRENKVKEYADNLYEGRMPTIQNEEEWLVLSFCKQELHNLYREEPKYLRSQINTSLWMLNGNNRPILARHKQEWDKLSPSEKAEKIFGTPKKYEITAGVVTAVTCFFLCHSIYQQVSQAR